MNEEQYQEQLKHLRSEWRGTSTMEEKARIHKKAQDFKKLYGCYFCQNHWRGDENSLHFPFGDSEQCHSAWANKNYGSGERKKKLSLQQIQEGFKQLQQNLKEEEPVKKPEELQQSLLEIAEQKKVIYPKATWSHRE
jgi:hypothetical protein